MSRSSSRGHGRITQRIGGGGNLVVMNGIGTVPDFTDRRAPASIASQQSTAVLLYRAFGPWDSHLVGGIVDDYPACG